jgi:hypothetical protein
MKLRALPHVIRNPLWPISNLSTCTSSPGAREPLFVATLLNLLKKKKAMDQKANVGHGRQKMDEKVRRESYPIIV